MNGDIHVRCTTNCGPAGRVGRFVGCGFSMQDFIKFACTIGSFIVVPAVSYSVTNRRVCINFCKKIAFKL